MNAPELANVLRRYSFDISSEATLQEGIERVLQQNSLAFEREVRLSARDRIDFLVGPVGLEVKIDGTANTVSRQLARYAEHARIEELLLVSSRVKLIAVPETIGGKRVTTVALVGSIF